MLTKAELAEIKEWNEARGNRHVSALLAHIEELDRLLNAWLNGFDHNMHLMNSEELRDIFGPMIRQTAAYLKQKEQK